MIRTLWRRYPDWVPTLGLRHRWPVGLIMALTPLVAGADFMMGEHDDELTIVTQTMPPILWGVLLIFAGGMAAGGYLTQRPWLCVSGLHLSAVLFATLAIGIVWDKLDEMGGFRGPWLYLIVAVLNWVAAVAYADQVKGRGR